MTPAVLLLLWHMTPSIASTAGLSRGEATYHPLLAVHPCEGDGEKAITGTYPRLINGARAPCQMIQSKPCRDESTCAPARPVLRAVPPRSPTASQART